MKELIDKINLDTWIISDLHLGHGDSPDRGILKFEPCRWEQMQKDGYAGNEHNKWIIDNWNKTVKPNDTVLFLGDFAFKQLIIKKELLDLYAQYKFYSKNEIIEVLKLFKNLKLHDLKYYCHIPKQHILIDLEGFKTIIKKYSILEEIDLSDRPEDLLNGEIIMITGNHDPKPLQFSNRNVSVIDGFYWNQGELMNKIEHPDPMFSGFIKTFGDKKYMFSHYEAHTTDEWDLKNKMIAPRIKVLKTIFEANKCDYNVHGHTHSLDGCTDYSINVSLEHINYKPIRLGDLLCLN